MTDSPLGPPESHLARKVAAALTLLRQVQGGLANLEIESLQEAIHRGAIDAYLLTVDDNLTAVLDDLDKVLTVRTAEATLKPQ